MIDRKRYQNSRFLNAADLTQPRTVVTITAVGEELVGDEKRCKLIVKVEQFSKGLACNLTNTDSLCQILGENEDLWPGKRIALVKARTLFSGRMTDCIRIEAAPALTAAA